jgi:hypothetical protein
MLNTPKPIYFYDNFKNREARCLIENYVNLINKTDIKFLTYAEVAKYMNQLLRMEQENNLTPLERDLFNSLLKCGAIRESKYAKVMKATQAN